eukprot:UC1_evm2s604
MAMAGAAAFEVEKPALCIKEMTIKGFKTYRDETFLEPFSPHHNVIVGRNGSGKSNFFFAIRFVLSDAFSTLRADERAKFLHEGAGQAVMSAYVEIVFDNSDSRIPLDAPEVRLRRTIGLKKDEYFLDSKHVNKGEVHNLLESAGFSRSNPYYIVQQGKITSLASASDSARLTLLKEVAGTSVYDERRRESVRILEDTQSKRERVAEVLEDIETRLSELEEEKDELREYQTLDRDHRTIEYTIASKELDVTRKTLEELEGNRVRESEKSQLAHRDHQMDAQGIEEMEAEMAECMADVRAIDGEVRTIEEDSREQVKRRATLELDIADLEAELGDDGARRSGAEGELKQLEADIAAKRAELEERILPGYKRVLAEEEGFRRDMAECERRQSELLAKQSRGTHFSSSAERDAHLNEKIASANEMLEAKRTQLTRASEEALQIEAALTETRADLVERQEAVAARRKLIDDANREFQELKSRRDALQNDRNQLRRRDADDERRTNNARQVVSDRERELLTTTSKSVSQGLESVRAIVSDPSNGIIGVHGPLIELITVQKQFEVPADITGGSALFNIVVDTDQVASDILRIMNTQKLPGRVTFLPLNKLRPKSYKYPASSDELVPLVETMNFDKKYQKAVDQIFGRTLVCRNLSVASRYSKQEGFDGITLEGDKVARKGALTGGYIDRGKNKINIQKRINEARETLDTALDGHDKLMTQMAEVDQEVTVVLGEIEKVGSRREQVRTALSHLRDDIARLQDKIKADTETLASRERTCANLSAEVSQLEAGIESLQAELGTDLNSQLETGEQEALNDISDTKQQTSAQILACIEERVQLEAEKDGLESELNDNLLKKHKNLTEELERLTAADGALLLESKREELSALSTGVIDAKDRLDRLVKEKEEATKRAAELTEALEEERAKSLEAQTTLEKAEKKMEKILNKRRILLQKQEETMRRIRDLGSLPADATDKYKDKTEAQLYKKLKSVKGKLKKYSHVNKKALDQYVNFSEQRDALLGRQQDQEKGDAAIHRLIEVLDNQKDEAIQLTFKQVAKYFGEVFKELVPQGHASLIMQRRAEQPADGDMEQESETEEDQENESGNVSVGRRSVKTRVEQFTGVSIRVNFTGRGEDTTVLQQLSGGQRTLVALTLIFAIQKCDPAPFYLFDEIDQALDAAHRASVAAMIYKRSRTAQYITTTFRPELLVNCDKVYGVSFADKVSRIDVVTKDDAVEFLEQLEEEQH